MQREVRKNSRLGTERGRPWSSQPCVNPYGKKKGTGEELGGREKTRRGRP